MHHTCFSALSFWWDSLRFSKFTKEPLFQSALLKQQGQILIALLLSIPSKLLGFLKYVHARLLSFFQNYCLFL